MATLVIMPRQGQSVESCVITAFNKKVGDTVEKGEVLFSYETDKSSFEEPAPEAGKILAVFREEGDDVPCLENVLVIGKEGEDISEFIPKTEAESAPTPEVVEEKKEEKVTETAVPTASPAPTADASGFSISPRAKLLAEKTHADLLKAIPTGPNGRIIERDVQKLVDQGLTVSPAAKVGYTSAVDGSGISGKVVLSDLNTKSAEEAPVAEATAPVVDFYDEKIPNIRKIIAKAMCQSLSSMAQLTFNSSFDATKMIALRNSLKAGAEKMGLANITYNDMILFAVSRVLKNHKMFNAHYLNDDTMRFFNTVNLGIAVDTERGLMVPTVFNAEKLSLNEMSVKAKSVITDAQSGKINPDLLKGATFTVSNLGSLGIESFTPIVNPPQTAILGVDCITKRIKEVNGEDVTYPAMGLSLTVDHRAIDGADAARFLKDVGFALENIDLLLTK
ncbi:MAG: 2-oxo acid dehydrogenase subunit E2 [Ruminococcaceae bacterium]|nr:2-oxo acid dehydrogenase subunit E2 [Oscillospiraceae bacterium]